MPEEELPEHGLSDTLSEIVRILTRADEVIEAAGEAEGLQRQFSGQPLFYSPTYNPTMFDDIGIITETLPAGDKDEIIK